MAKVGNLVEKKSCLIIKLHNNIVLLTFNYYTELLFLTNNISDLPISLSSFQKVPYAVTNIYLLIASQIKILLFTDFVHRPQQ